MKILPFLTAFTISLCVNLLAKAGDIIKIDRLNAQSRTIQLDVTPMGLAIDLGSPISAVNISHKSQLVFSGMDGVLCPSKANCGEQNPPTILFVRKIPTIDFKDEEAMPNGTSLLFVDTESGMYRFEFKPVNKTPQYTKVEIQEEAVTPLLPTNNHSNRF